MTRLAFAPVIPVSLLTALAVVALLLTAYAFYMRARGAWARGLAFAVLIFALAAILAGYDLFWWFVLRLVLRTS